MRYLQQQFSQEFPNQSTKIEKLIFTKRRNTKQLKYQQQLMRPLQKYCPT
jgi:hypothetical protein